MDTATTIEGVRDTALAKAVLTTPTTPNYRTNVSESYVSSRQRPALISNFIIGFHSQIKVYNRRFRINGDEPVLFLGSLIASLFFFTSVRQIPSRTITGAPSNTDYSRLSWKSTGLMMAANLASLILVTGFIPTSSVNPASEFFNNKPNLTQRNCNLKKKSVKGEKKALSEPDCIPLDSTSVPTSSSTKGKRKMKKKHKHHMSSKKTYTPAPVSKELRTASEMLES